jgi:hypothetical protein
MKHCRSCLLVDGKEHEGRRCKRSMKPDGNNIACDHRLPKDANEYKGLGGA